MTLRTTSTSSFAPLKRYAERIGLTINSTNTKYMAAGRDRDRSSGVAEVVFDGAV